MRCSTAAKVFIPSSIVGRRCPAAVKSSTTSSKRSAGDGVLETKVESHAYLAHLQNKYPTLTTRGDCRGCAGMLEFSCPSKTLVCIITVLWLLQYLNFFWTSVSFPPPIPPPPPSILFSRFFQNKLKWGSQPQFGDWGTSQPASAGSLRHLASRLTAFVGRSSNGGRVSRPPLSARLVVC